MSFSIKYKLGIVLGALILCTLFLGGLNWVNIRGVQFLMKERELWCEIDMMMNEDVHQPLLMIDAGIARYASTFDSVQARKVKEEFKKLKQNIVDWAKLAPDNGELLRFVSWLQKRVSLLEGKFDEMTKVADKQVLQEQAAEIFKLQDSIGAALEKFMEELIDPTKEGVAQKIDLKLQVMKRAGLWANVVGLLLGIGILVIVDRKIARPINRLADQAQKISRGELDYTSIDVSGGDEIGQLAHAMQAMSGQIRDVLHRVKETTENIQYGKLRYRSSAKGLEGEFASMLEDINGLADVLVNDIDNLPQPVMVLDKDFNVLYLNRVGKKLGGSDAEGRKCYEVFKTSDCQTEKCACARAMRTLQKEISETDAHPGGLDLEIEYHAHPILDKDGKAVGALELIIDQTVIKNMLNKIKRVTAKANEIFERVPFIIIALDEKDKVVHWNPMAENFFGLRKEEVLGQSILDLTSKLGWKETMGISANDYLQDRCNLQKEVRYNRPDGSTGFMDFKVIDFLDLPDPEERMLLLVGNDITEFKIMQGQLAQAQKLEAIGQLAAGIAHEINTPAQYVSDNLHFLQDSFVPIKNTVDFFVQSFMIHKDKLPRNVVDKIDQILEENDLNFFMEEVPKALEQSLEGIGRIAKIVSSMKQFAHPGTENKVYADLNKAIENACEVTRNVWKYVADMETDLDPDLPQVLCFPGEINQVLLNMIVNAADAIKEKLGESVSGEERGLIKISTRTLKDRVQIQISDTGCGIPKEIRDRIFEPFFTTKEVGKGTGQGLAIAHSIIVDKHNGSIKVESEPGEGTTFIIELPVNG